MGNSSSSSITNSQNADVDSLQEKMNALLSKYSREYLLYFNNTLRPKMMGGITDDYRDQVIEVVVCDIKCPRNAKFIDSNGKCKCVDAGKMKECTCDEVGYASEGGCGGCATGCRGRDCWNSMTGRWESNNKCGCNGDGGRCDCPAPGTGFYAKECKLPSEWHCRDPKQTRFYVNENGVLQEIKGKCARTSIKIKGTLSQLIAGGEYTLGNPLDSNALCYPQVSQSVQLTQLEKELREVSNEIDNKIRGLQRKQNQEQKETIHDINQHASILSKYRAMLAKIKVFDKENVNMHTMIEELTLRVTSAKTRYFLWVCLMFIMLFITWRHLTKSSSL